MGNLLERAETTEQDRSAEEIQNLKRRLADVENLDRNGDGFVSRREMQEWLEKEKKEIEQFKTSIQANTISQFHADSLLRERELNDVKMKMLELQKQNDKLSAINDDLEVRLENSKKNLISKNLSKSMDSNNLIENSDSVSEKAKLSDISKTRIADYVNKMLKDNAINSKLIPDYIERKIYTNVIGLVIGLIDNMVDNTSIRFMDHELKFDLRPVIDSIEKENAGLENPDKSSKSLKSKKNKKMR